MKHPVHYRQQGAVRHRPPEKVSVLPPTNARASFCFSEVVSGMPIDDADDSVSICRVAERHIKPGSNSKKTSTLDKTAGRDYCLSSTLYFRRITMSDSQTARKQGFRQFAIGMFMYVAIVIATGFLVDPEIIPTVYGVLLALLPMAAAIWVMSGWLSAVLTLVMLQQKVCAEAGLVSLLLTAVVTFTYVFLEALVNLPSLSMLVVFPFI